MNEEDCIKLYMALTGCEPSLARNVYMFLETSTDNQRKLDPMDEYSWRPEIDPLTGKPKNGASEQ